jgi:hypothetical protein
LLRPGHRIFRIKIFSQSSRDEAEAVAGGGDVGVGVTAAASLEIFAIGMALWFKVPEHWLTGGSAPRLLRDPTVDVSFLAGVAGAQGLEPFSPRLFGSSAPPELLLIRWTDSAA